MIIWDRIEDDKKDGSKVAEYAFHSLELQKYVIYPNKTLRDADPDCSPRLEKMVRSFYHELEFPDGREHFGDVAIYIRWAAMPSS